MKKKLATIVTCTFLTSLIPNGSIHSVYAENNEKTVSTTQTQKEEVSRGGLIGYYFKGKDFNNLTMFAPTINNTLIYDRQTADTLLNKQQQEFNSIRWIGLIQSKETGDFTFQLSDDKNAIIEIDGKVVSRRGEDKQTIHLEKGKMVPIKIEYQSNEPLTVDSKVFNDLKLFKIDGHNQSHQIQQDDLKNPEFNKKETKELLSKTAKRNLFSSNEVRSDEDDDLDTDGDSIPDNWEMNGYTIQRKMAVKWDDSFAEKGYTKFVSNPYEAHTAGDPYTDYEKAAKDIPLSNAKEAFNPLVAAFPSVNVGLEKVVISKNEDMSQGVSSSTSNSASNTNSIGVTVDAGWEGLFPKFGISTNYQNTWTTAQEWGSSKEDSTHINGAQSAFLNANVRYQNVGTGAIYDVKPTTSFVLDGTTIGTIKAKENTTALSLSPGDSYPKRGQNGIAINTMDDFNSHPIPLNKEQLNSYMSNKAPILMETNQTEGKYAIKDVNGQTVVAGDWNGIQQQIENKTTSIIVDNGGNVTEKRIAGKDYSDPEDLTPGLTFREALKLAYPDEVTEKDGLLFYNNKPIYEEAVQSYLDEYTAKQVKKQLEDTTGKFKDVKKLYDVKLEPKMNFTIKTSTIYDGAESGDLTTNEVGTWTDTYVFNDKPANTGKYAYYSNSNNKTKVTLSNEARKKLQPNTNYYLSFYMKRDGTEGANVPVKIYDVNGNEIKSEVIKVPDKKAYQRYNILIPNVKGHEIGSVTFESSGKFINFDDVAFTEVGAAEIENNGLSDLEIQKIYKDTTELWGEDSGSTYLNGVLFKNIEPFMGDQVKAYRVVYQGARIPSGIDESFDVTKPAYAYNKDGSVKVNFLEYNKGMGIDFIPTIDSIRIYAVLTDNRQVLVYQKADR
ncbi:Vip1Ea1 (plasmid) [Bacillus thuringiensis serovar morrisoni str. 4AA1]|uniref:binary toxin-like calcium binding domain-containing protein n=1 Tax=Bacillus TaxID=1386 RepID=UPI000A38BD03|nr:MULTISPECIES: binary toxin-like calcium binding domain-containing protein [Bacillus]MED3102193.1 PA14 domain-containing protein [Bacillus thuringiensis]MRA99106.1 hypothetical protein [Bacillus thuringiensis]OTY31046.1 hypothetical protein BK736_26440 [Bacillus thuringiensis serovar poloniensis]RNG36105.1 hypothetical protein EEL55_22580 [Bacillus thuringiensis]RUR59429.1 hypothetical protein ELS81_29995 [Bacillus sp. VKPM B-3276]